MTSFPMGSINHYRKTSMSLLSIAISDVAMTRLKLPHPAEELMLKAVGRHGQAMLGSLMPRC